MRKVLIADDLSVNRKILREMLQRDYEVLEAENGQKVLEILDAYSTEISAVLLDVMMPEMDGCEVLRRMRANPALSSVPVLVITGSDAEDLQLRALALGANDFIIKPYNPAIIRHCLHNNIKLREAASTINTLERDRLTGVYNREGFFAHAGQLLRGTEAGAYILSAFDIDSFKLVNDQYGMAEGDRILRHIGAAAGAACERFGGLCGRISGDHFAFLYANTPEAAAYFDDRGERRFLPEDRQSKLPYSVGRYLVSDLSLGVSAMYDRARLANQSVKKQYHHVAWFDESMLQKLVREQRLAGEMEEALGSGQFEVWFQPFFNGATGALIGAEALARWNHPVWGMIAPTEFLPVFERNGFIYELDKYIWARTCRLLRAWLDEGLEVLPVSVNISRCDVFREDLIGTLLGLVKEYRLPAALLRLEITEAAFEEDTNRIVQVVRALNERGFTVTIDDFGCGNSSLKILKDVPAEILKLDMNFLESHENAERSGSILDAIVRMAKWIGMSVLAEGVETHEQADFLRSIGCRYMQGFLLASPMSETDYRAYFIRVDKEPKLATLETVAHLDNGRFWAPDSLDTLVFNRFVGAACVVEFDRDRSELLRYNERYLQEICATADEQNAKQRWDPLTSMDEQSRARALEAIHRAIDEQTETGCEVFIPSSRPEKDGLYLRLSLRAIARADTRSMIYCCLTNITQQRLAEELLRVREAEYRIAVKLSGMLIFSYRVDAATITMSEAAAVATGLSQRVENVPDALLSCGFVRPDHSWTFRAMFDQIGQGQQTGWALFPAKTAKGWRWVKAQYSTIFSETGTPLSAVISLRDVSDEMEKENLYRKWQQGLRQRGEDAYALCRCNLSRGGTPTEQEGRLISMDFPEAQHSLDAFSARYAEDYVAEEDRAAFRAFLHTDTLMAGYYGGRRSSSLEYREWRGGGEVRWIRLAVDTMAYAASAEVEAFLQFEDIDQSKRAELLIQKRALTDALTGVLNRTAFAARMSQAISDSPEGTCHALLMLDLDGFKQVNDTFGHVAGDQVLVTLTQRLSGVLRRDDLIGRLGGDEFLIFMRGIPGDEVAEAKANLVCEITREDFPQSIRLSTSVGIAMSPRDGSSFDELYQRADTALYAVKGAGRNHYLFYDSSMGLAEAPSLHASDEGEQAHEKD